METTTHRMYFTVWKCRGITLIRSWSILKAAPLLSKTSMRITQEQNTHPLWSIAIKSLGVGGTKNN
jgi:hypothetical protein